MGHVLSGFLMELMMTSSKRAYVTGCVRPRSAVPKVPALQQVTADPYLLRRHSNTQRQVWLSLCGVSGSWCTPGCVWALWESLVDMGFDLNVIFHLPTIFLGVCGGVCKIQHSPANGYSAVSCSFGILSGENEHMSFPLPSCFHLAP